MELVESGVIYQSALELATDLGMETQIPCLNDTDYVLFYFSPEGGYKDPLPTPDQVNDAQLGCDNPQEHFWFDNVHPTTAGYE